MLLFPLGPFKILLKILYGLDKKTFTKENHLKIPEIFRIVIWKEHDNLQFSSIKFLTNKPQITKIFLLPVQINYKRHLSG